MINKYKLNEVHLHFSEKKHKSTYLKFKEATRMPIVTDLNRTVETGYVHNKLITCFATNDSITFPDKFEGYN